MEQKFKDKVINLLLQDERLKDEQGEIRGNLLREFVNNIDEKLIEILITDDEVRDKFFLKIKDVYVFKTNEFKFFLEENKIDNSFTQYSNRIGLASGGKFIKDYTDVVLNFPFKDTILEGGQSTEEGIDANYEYDEKEKDYVEKQSKRKEIFFNEILAKDEIDRLFEPKAFSKIKKYDKNGVSTPEKFNRNEEGIIKDNLIIKGNNLLALKSIEKEFNEKIKLIYIDPPYNTGNDEFKYNDKFPHSTWLTFMKNRLEIAKKLLNNEGAIFISINHIELGYLQVLMDEIFGRDNKLPLITLKAGTTASYRSINDCPVNVSEYILAYSKSNKFKPNNVYRKANYSEDYSHYIINIEKEPSEWKLERITDIIHKKNGCNNWREYKKKFGSNWKKKRFDEMEEFAYNNKESVVSLNTLQKPSKAIKEIIEKSKNNKGKIFEIEREKNNNIYCYNGRTLAFFSSKFRNIEGDIVPSEILTNIWTDVSFLGIGPEGGVKLENGKKPEYLLKTIIELITDKNDIVLDYHLGTGTTSAVAHKMGRQYIGIEQLDYGKNDSIIRLQNVIKGDQTGISQYDDIKWKGGGEFIYLELAKFNEKAKEEIINCNSYDELMKYFDEMYNKYFLHYNVRVKEFKEKISKEETFKKLPLERQKEIFAKMLDLNQMYVNASEMEDKKYNLDENDITLTKDFYQITD